MLINFIYWAIHFGKGLSFGKTSHARWNYKSSGKGQNHRTPAGRRQKTQYHGWKKEYMKKQRVDLI